MKTYKPFRLASLFRSCALFGLAIAIAMNLVALLFFKRPSAVFFSSKWWSDWFPSYMIWLTFAIIGFCWPKRDGTKADS